MEAIRILLVDDEVDFLATVSKRLKKRQVDVEQVTSGEKALVFLSSHPVDVVVLDVKMPGMGGMAALREIKKAHPLVEVILLTGHADMESAVQGMEVGAFDYLMKPMDIDELLYKVQDAARKKSHQEQKIRDMEGKR